MEQLILWVYFQIEHLPNYSLPHKLIECLSLEEWIQELKDAITK